MASTVSTSTSTEILQTIVTRPVRISTRTTYSMAHQETNPIPAIRIRLLLSKYIFYNFARVKVPQKLFMTRQVWLIVK